MKQIIKNHYKIPLVDPNLLRAVLEKQKPQTRIHVLLLSLSLGVFFAFGKHVLDFNISYIDISSSMISHISLPLFIIGNIMVALSIFIYKYVFLLLLVSLIYFLVSIQNIYSESL